MMWNALKHNWKIYLMEAICLGLFMVSASVVCTVLEYPGSVVHQALQSAVVRNCLMGLAMGVTATALIYSPFGKLSGAHMNPAVTITFLWFKKISRVDAFFYIIFQCVGGMLAVYLMHLLIGDPFEHVRVNFVVTAPSGSVLLAFIVEITIAFVMMSMVLTTSNDSSLSRYTGLFSGILVMLYVIISGPISGFGMNPARSLASAVPAMQFPSFWIYIVAPFIGMLGAALMYRVYLGKVLCAKMHHDDAYPCPFDCGYCKHVHEPS